MKKTEAKKPRRRPAKRHDCRRLDPAVQAHIDQLHESVQDIMRYLFCAADEIDDCCATVRMAQMLHLDLAVSIGMVSAVVKQHGVTSNEIAEQFYKAMSLGMQIINDHSDGLHDLMPPDHVHKINPPPVVWGGEKGSA